MHQRTNYLSTFVIRTRNLLGDLILYTGGLRHDGLTPAWHRARPQWSRMRALVRANNSRKSESTAVKGSMKLHNDRVLFVLFILLTVFSTRRHPPHPVSGMIHPGVIQPVLTKLRVFVDKDPTIFVKRDVNTVITSIVTDRVLPVVVCALFKPTRHRT